MKQPIVVAGATGNLGGRIVRELLKKEANVRVLVRPGSDRERVANLQKEGAVVITIRSWNVAELTEACRGAACIVSALSGLHDVVVDAQKVLLDAAVNANVLRFIPSDFSIDFTRLPAGRNRNLDLRREFHTYLDKAPIAATTIFNGAFAELLTGDMPLVLFKLKQILYWGNADQRMDFTTMDNVATFTANAALDPTTPRYLHIAGDQISARQLVPVAGEVTGTKFSLLRPGGLGLLSMLIKIARTVAPGGNDLYPAWQGMQYMRDMLDGRAEMKTLDNNRYPGIKWTTARDVLAAHQVVQKSTMK
ncbi:NmrA family NAD(P)-binding protein [Fibrella sp. HMF5335]|uniref:NmrA family NAD(P)-binding protein n=1 Tax=Fibrella rubiginis TaxID=2817060 RepID=A0A939K780_9BACT|nr:NmrA family NAD(P)-binding protein [Fibrella rubiginis]MBO0939116.1 NmrA family NAD(P)-binding protein [Fibrella rubiginis]